MRTIEEIKTEIQKAWMSNETLAAAYGFTLGAEWNFSRVSLENIIVWLVATAIWTHEKLFEAHDKEVAERIEQLRPHTLRWYASMAKKFRFGQALNPDDDTYSDLDENGAPLGDDVIAEREIVKFAACTAPADQLLLKVATGDNANRAPLSPEQLEAFKAYVQQIKDAGVPVRIINQPADELTAQITVYYDPLVLNGNGKPLSNPDGDEPALAAVRDYIVNLPFDSRLRLDRLTDRLQAVEGVVLPVVESVSSGGTIITAFHEPLSGYFSPESNINITYTAWNEKAL